MKAPGSKKIIEWLGHTLTKEHGDNAINKAITLHVAMLRAETHEDIDKAMDKANEILAGYGVEVIRGQYVNRYYGDINALFVNMGDTYAPTVIYDTEKEMFLVMSWGDLVEKYPKGLTIRRRKYGNSKGREQYHL